MSTNFQSIDYEFIGEIVTGEDDGSWHYLVIPKSAERFGKAKSIKIKGTVDSLEFEATMLPMGQGTHLLPLRADIRKKIGKGAGDTVTVKFTEFK